MSAECEIHGGDADTCPPCQRAADQGHGPAIPTGPAKLRTFEARYAGNCSGCGSLILPGDEIARDPDGDGYLDEPCTEEASR